MTCSGAAMSRRLPPYRTFLASDAVIREILRSYRTIAMVGLGPDAPPAARDAARQLKQRGYRVLPVHPGGGEVLGMQATPDLRALGERIEIVAVISAALPVAEVVDQALAAGAKVLWLEPGGSHPESAYRAARAGLAVILNRELLAEYLMHFPDSEIGYERD